MKLNEIINHFPITSPFLFVDQLHYVDRNGSQGTFTFHENLDFYKGHFTNHPVTPGTILLETMTQIGGAPLILYLTDLQGSTDMDIKNFITVASSFESVNFYKPVFPNETVTVTSEIIYFRFGKIKYKAKMEDENGQLIAKGIFSGMVKQMNTNE